MVAVIVASGTGGTIPGLHDSHRGDDADYRQQHPPRPPGRTAPLGAVLENLGGHAVSVRPRPATHQPPEPEASAVAACQNVVARSREPLSVLCEPPHTPTTAGRTRRAA